MPSCLISKMRIIVLSRHLQGPIYISIYVSRSIYRYRDKVKIYNYPNISAYCIIRTKKLSYYYLGNNFSNYDFQILALLNYTVHSLMYTTNIENLLCVIQCARHWGYICDPKGYNTYTHRCYSCRGAEQATLKCATWHVNYLELKTIKVQKTQEEIFYFPLNCHKEFRKRVWLRKRAITRDNYKECRLGVVSCGELSRVCLFKLLSVSHCLYMA